MWNWFELDMYEFAWNNCGFVFMFWNVVQELQDVMVRLILKEQSHETSSTLGGAEVAL